MNSKPLSVLLEEAFVQCRDMDASLAFYESLGFEVVGRLPATRIATGDVGVQLGDASGLLWGMCLIPLLG